jgi:hypothetical protein
MVLQKTLHASDMMVDENPTDSPVGSEETVTRSDLEADTLNKGQHTLVVNCNR